ncbi:MAG: DUF2911 domain-containing protein [Candidatus Latescibacter sp.]|nr:DUF2911 domain-containing protein [Candidatus Latescibacter sp.]
MKRFNIALSMVSVLLLVIPSAAQAQGEKVRASLKASVTQRLGIDTDITIDYSRPGVKGRVIWGKLVPYGLAPGNNYSKDKPFPWRAGANENTTIQCTKDILVEGKKLPAGKYGIHMIPSEKNWIIAFSKKNDLDGSYLYNQEDDIFRITVTPISSPHQEWLLYGFDDLSGTSATAFLHWEKLKVPFKIQIIQ